MSWDIYLVRTETNIESKRQISEENIIKFTREEVIRELVLLAKELGVSAEDLETKYVHLRGDNWSIEFNLGDGMELYNTIDMEVRGTKQPTEVLSRLKKDLKARILDMCAGEFWEEDCTSGFEGWKALNTQVIQYIAEE